MFDSIPDKENEIVGTLKQSARDRGWFSTSVGFVGVILVIVLIGGLATVLKGWGMTDAEGAISVLRAEGFEDITITGYRWYTCSDDDYFHTGFSAVGPSGRPVTGTVCKGFFFKSSTVRID